MDIEKAKKMSYENIRKMYKNHLDGQELSRNTVQTMSVDTFYLWNNGSSDLFWSTVASNDFENDAKEALLKTLSENSSGNVSALVNGYLANLRKFRTYILSDDAQDDVQALRDFLLDIEIPRSISGVDQ